ncbi:MAG: PDZ domain-containing protein [Pseudomonadota bacterium]
MTFSAKAARVATLLLAAVFAASMQTQRARAADQTLLLRDPTVSETQLVFVYAGDLWIAGRDGADPRRLTATPYTEANPIFSPDGAMIAYTANAEGNGDVYVIAASGGQPKRLTWHPGRDVALDWAPDGSAVAFSSRRETDHGRSAQLYHVSVDGGLPEKQMEARIFRGAYDAAAARFAYIDHAPAYGGLYGGASGWRGYRGGTTPSVTILNRETAEASEIPGDRVNDIEPMWVGDDVYFVSDREGKVFNLYKYDAAEKTVAKVSNETVWDVRAADAHGETIVYEAGGRLKQLNVASGETAEIVVSINPDLPQLRPQWKDASDVVSFAAISPTGKRVAVTARGDVFTVPTDEGSTRNLTRTDGAREYTAIWSPDGQEIAYIDASEAEQKLVIRPQTGLGEARTYSLGEAFNYLMLWGGDGRRIIYRDNRLRLFAIDPKSGEKTLISTGARREGVEASSSPDGRWLAYTEEQPNFNGDLFLYDFETGEATRISDGLADVSAPAFSPDGKYLFFAASTNSGPLQVGLDLSSQERPYRAGIYALVLAKDGVSPVKPGAGDEEPDEENGDEDADDQKDAGAKDAKDGGSRGFFSALRGNRDEKDDADKKSDDDEDENKTKVDLDGLSDRIVALPVAKRNYGDLAVAKDGSLYFVRRVQPGATNAPPGESVAAENALMRFDFEEKKAEAVMSGVTGLAISADGEHILVQKAGGDLSTGKTGGDPELESVGLGDVRMLVDPRAEWAQIFDETWRMEKAFFYDPGLHGLNWDAVYERYRPLLDHVGRREDLSALLVEMIAEMQVGHNNTGGGDAYYEDGPGVGLLGADLRLDNGRHRIARIYDGENWNPFLTAPLAAPGLEIAVGDYILAVDGRPLGERDNIFQFLQGTAGKQVTLRVASGADGADARDVVVQPTGQEYLLRLWSWIEGNRKRVAEATEGRVGYVYLPNTAGAGYTLFNRMFFAQVDKDAMIIDERSNSGGQAANYITDVLSRTYLSGWKDRDGAVFNTPGGAMFGPKVMLIDQDAGSGGDFLPYSFRSMNIGPLIGTRTWGGLIGISANPSLIDGGFLTVPYFRFFDADYKWTVENEGVAPDIEVALDPVAYNEGRDAQLERAIEEVVKRLETEASTVPETAPPYPTELGK